jgi:hypothetical protein
MIYVWHTQKMPATIHMTIRTRNCFSFNCFIKKFIGSRSVMQAATADRNQNK